MQPIHLRRSLLLFGLPALLFLFLDRVILPRLDAAGASPLLGFCVLLLPHVLFFLGAFVGYRLEGNPWSRAEIAQRFRLRRLGARGWGWAAAAALVNIGLYLSVFVLARPVVRWLHDLVPDPEALRNILGDSTTFVGFPLAGNWWLLGLYLVLYFFNVMGEELWWRGYIFPRQEIAHGRHTWLVHGFLWAAFHLFSPYNALMVLPGALAVSWIVQRQKNTWIFVVAHAALNGMAMIRIVSGILG